MLRRKQGFYDLVYFHCASNAAAYTPLTRAWQPTAQTVCGVGEEGKSLTAIRMADSVLERTPPRRIARGKKPELVGTCRFYVAGSGAAGGTPAGAARCRVPRRRAGRAALAHDGGDAACVTPRSRNAYCGRAAAGGLRPRAGDRGAVGPRSPFSGCWQRGGDGGPDLRLAPPVGTEPSAFRGGCGTTTRKPW